MKILIVTQYFWPEEFRINDIVKNLLEKGHQVDVITGVPSYPDNRVYVDFKKNKKKYDNFFGANIIRLPIFRRGNSSPARLFLNYLSFILSGIFIGTYKIRKKNYDIIFTFATSPITVALPSIFFSFIKNCQHVLWVLDIWPDILKELRIVENNILIFFLRKIVNFIYRKTDLILAQSKSFQRIISESINDNTKVDFFPAWSEDLISNENSNRTSLEYAKYKNKFNIVFTGNIGEAQNFEKIIEAAEILKHKENLQWLIIGTGRKIDEYKELVFKKKIKNFLFIDHKPVNEIKSFHKIADILLVSLSGGKFLSATIPGKLQTYMMSNKFIVGFIKGEAAKIITDSKVGTVVDPSNSKQLAEVLNYLKNNPKILKEPRINHYGSKYLKKNFNKKIILDKLELYLNYIFQEIKIIKNIKSIPFDRNFSLSGLNLAFLGYWIKKKIIISKDIYLWPDGIFFKRFFNSKFIKKIPGREIVNSLRIPNAIKNIYVIGNLKSSSKKYLKFLYKRRIIHIPLPFGNVENLYKRHCNFQFSSSDLIFLTLPTPKQEQFANLIIRNNRFFKIICIGGAINMASGVEKEVPLIIEKINLEFLWRLQTDTYRRIRRLFVSSIFYLKGELLFKFRNINLKILDEK